MGIIIGGGSSTSSSSAGDSSDYLDSSVSSSVTIPQAYINVLEGESFKARLGGSCGTGDDWYIVLTIPTFADSSKVFAVHNVNLFAQDGAAQVKFRVGVTEDYDTSYGEAITAIPYNGILGVASNITAYQYIGTDADGLPSELGTAYFYGEVGNFGLCENDVDGINKGNPLFLNNGDTFIVQVSNEYYQDQRITVEVDWWEIDGEDFSSDFTDNLS